MICKWISTTENCSWTLHCLQYCNCKSLPWLRLADCEWTVCYLLVLSCDRGVATSVYFQRRGKCIVVYSLGSVLTSKANQSRVFLFHSEVLYGYFCDAKCPVTTTALTSAMTVRSINQLLHFISFNLKLWFLVKSNDTRMLYIDLFIIKHCT